MLPDFFLNYTDYFQPLNLFKYITFRSIGSLLTALIISFVFGSKIINFLKAMKRIEEEREEKKRKQMKQDGDLLEFEDRGGFAQVLKEIFSPTD